MCFLQVPICYDNGAAICMQDRQSSTIIMSCLVSNKFVILTLRDTTGILWRIPNWSLIYRLQHNAKTLSINKSNLIQNQNRKLTLNKKNQ